MARRIESHLLDGPAGKLESLLEEPEDREPREAALICHPHPLYGGTMHNKVVYRIARALRRSGCVVLRFNFRGVGRSQGEHAHGNGEIEDARHALAWLRARYPELPFSLAGFSFGSRVILKLGCSLAPPPSRLIAVGFAAREEDLEFLGSCGVPKIFVQSTQDEFGPRATVEPIYSRAAAPAQSIWVEADDHFFAGALDNLEEALFRAAQPTS